MSHSFEIIFEPLPVRERKEILTDCVITPIDRFTRRIVSRGISAKIERFGAVARRSLSGHLFFERLPEDGPFVATVDTRQSGYFQVGQQTVPAPIPPAVAARKTVELDLRPDRVVDGESAVIRGGVRRGTAWIEGAIVSTRVQGAPASVSFETRSDRSGAFALRLRLPEPEAGVDFSVPLTGKADLTARFDGVEVTRTNIDITDMQTKGVGIIDLPET